MHTWFYLIATFMLVGCVGTLDSVHFIEGTAPIGNVCKIEIISSDSSEIRRAETVSGPFRIGLTAGGFLVSPIDVVASCNGEVVKRVASIKLRSVQTISLGKL